MRLNMIVLVMLVYILAVQARGRKKDDEEDEETYPTRIDEKGFMENKYCPRVHSDDPKFIRYIYNDIKVAFDHAKKGGNQIKDIMWFNLI